MTEWKYPGDDAVRRAFVANVLTIIKEKGLTLEEFERREIYGPRDASSKRIRFVEDILRNCIKTLDKDFRKSRIPQMKGFSLKPEKDLRKRRKR